jgi:hypothetical protein
MVTGYVFQQRILKENERPSRRGRPSTTDDLSNTSLACVMFACTYSATTSVLFLFWSRMLFVHLSAFPHALCPYDCAPRLLCLSLSLCVTQYSAFFASLYLLAIAIALAKLLIDEHIALGAVAQAPMRSMRSMRGGFIFRNRGPSL